MVTSKCTSAKVALAAAALIGSTAVVRAESAITTKISLAACLNGCWDAIGEVSFNDTDPTADYYNALFTSKLWVSSLIACGDKYCTSAQLDAGWKVISGYGEEYAEPPVSLPTYDVARSYTTPGGAVETDILGNIGMMYNNTILADQASFQAGLDTENTWDREMIYHHAYGWALYILTAAAVLVGLLSRAFTAFTNRYPADIEELNGEQSLMQKSYTYYRRWLGVPAVFGYTRAQSWYGMSLPTRLQGFWVFAYCLINLVFTLATYHLFDNNLYWYQNKPEQLWRYVADRTGIMCFYNMPLLWILAGRNDFLLWLTGWSFSSLNIFHRWAARVATLQAIIHSAAWTWLEKGSLALMFKDNYWATGVFATVFMSIMLPLSIRPFRTKLYEIFLLLHIGMAMAVLILCFYHVKIWDGEYDGWLWTCVAVWLFDRVARVARMLVLSFKTFRSAGAGGLNTIGTMTGSREHGLIRLEVTTSINFNPSPGTYYYLYTPRMLNFWENHPFTLASWKKDGDKTQLHFLVAPQRGATRVLFRKLDRAENGVANLRVLVEGPYGSSHNLRAFDTVVFVAGGSGITAILPYLYELRTTQKTSYVRRVVVVWAVKDTSYAADVMKNELAEVSAITELHIHATSESEAAINALPVLTTSSAASSSSIEHEQEHEHHDQEKDAQAGSSARASSDEGEGKAVVHAKKGSGITMGRPDLHATIAEGVASSRGRVAVMACGPEAMMDDLRRLVAGMYGTGKGQVSGSRLEYFEEQFAW